ncbi:MAG: T9SS type A sorting domain-containing protein [Candidatus Sabulitectum sp.]|nr:T9SS type A sorting domain-containing protein [Candidatus Sabulitectum sp.]
MDWDGDGLNDLVVGQGSNSSGSVQVFSNNGNGTVSDPFYVYIESGEPIKSSSGSAFIQILDFVPDGRFDLLVGMGSSTSSEYTLVFENDPDTWVPPYNPVFLEPDTLTSVGVKINHGPSCSWIGDLDNDGFPDLVVSDYHKCFFFYQGTGPMGTMDFAEQDTLRTPSGVIVTGDTPHPCLCDWDGDGDLDLLTGNNYYPDTQRSSSGIFLFRNTIYAGVDPQVPQPQVQIEIAVTSPVVSTVEITVEESISGPFLLSIFSIDGRRVYSRECFIEGSGMFHQQLDVTFLPPGLYTVVVEAGKSTASTGFVILP